MPIPTPKPIKDVDKFINHCMSNEKRFRRFAENSYDKKCGTIICDALGGTDGVDYAIRKVKQIEG